MLKLRVINFFHCIIILVSAIFELILFSADDFGLAQFIGGGLFCLIIAFSLKAISLNRETIKEEKAKMANESNKSERSIKETCESSTSLLKQIEKEKAEKELNDLLESAKSLHILEEKDGENITYYICGDYKAVNHLSRFRMTIEDNGDVYLTIFVNPKFPFHRGSEDTEVKTEKFHIENEKYFIVNSDLECNEWSKRTDKLQFATFNGEQMIVDQIELGRKGKLSRDNEFHIAKLKSKYGNLSEEERAKILSKWRDGIRKKKEEEEERLKIKMEEEERLKREKEEKERERTYVYLMCNKQNNFHKIGISKNLEHRERTLQSAEPLIECLGARLYETRRDAYNAEQELHNMFKHKNIRGEWFNLTEDDIELVCNYLNVS